MDACISEEMPRYGERNQVIYDLRSLFTAADDRWTSLNLKQKLKDMKEAFKGKTREENCDDCLLTGRDVHRTNNQSTEGFCRISVGCPSAARDHATVSNCTAPCTGPCMKRQPKMMSWTECQ